MVKPTPDPPQINLPSDHPLLNFPSELNVVDANVLAKRFARQRAMMKQAKRREICGTGVLHRCWRACRGWFVRARKTHE